MFVEELMPPECLFLSPLRAAQEPKDLTGAFQNMPVIRLGGDETIGRGVTHLSYVPVTRAGGAP
jgi:CRISPR/Cas system CMR subunit Cmr4 (Cas7 group RAMP superfamily)